MRKVLVLIAAIAFAGIATATATRMLATQAQPAQATKVCTVKVTGMTCSGCEAAVRIAAEQIDGVKDAKASYTMGTAEITYDPAKTAPDA
ncbi:MAG: cation transporter, partial [Vicinamibacterales bacterium]